MIGIPNGSKVLPNLAEMRIRQNFFYKGGRTERGSATVGEEWMWTPQIKSSLYATPTYPHFHWIGWAIIPQMKWGLFSTQWLHSLPARTMSNGVVTLSILRNFRIHAHDKRREKPSVAENKSRDLEYFLRLLSCLT